MKGTKQFTFLGFFIWLLASIFFLYEFFLRVFVSTISDRIIHDFHLTPQQYSYLGMGYYLIYSIMQIPVGILADRFGARILLTGSTVIASVGAIWFAASQTFQGALVSRIFMGFGSSFAYVCLLVLALNWFPKSHFGLMVGIANLFGASGPFLAGGPLSILLNAFNNDWRLVFTVIALFGFLLAALIGLFVRNNPARKKKEVIFLDPNKETLTKRLALLANNSQSWLIVLYAGFVYVCLSLLGAYWGTGFLRAKGLSRDVAASISSMLWVGYAIGAPLTGKISDSIKRRKPILLLCSFLGTLSCAGIVFWPTTPPLFYGLLFLCVGVASSGVSISVATLSEQVESKLHATAIGLNNSSTTLFAAFIPPGVSALIAQASGGEAGVKISLAAFQSGLFVMPLIYLCSFLICLFFIQETYARSQVEIIKTRRRSLH